MSKRNLTGEKFGTFQIRRKLGEGGMAVVYEAYDESLDRTVAIKVVKDHLAAEDEQFIQRFKREAQAVARLSHPNIVQVYSIGEHEETHFFVMEYVRGKTLRELIEEEGFLTPARALPIVRHVAKALAEAHDAGIVHRDIKPANILIDSRGRTRVMDFGIARVENQAGLTQTGMLVGTPEFMSPEQCRGDSVGPRSDIYSLGVTLYQALSGHTPYSATTPTGIVIQVAKGERTPIQELNPTVPDEVRAILERMMALDPGDRYQTAEDLLEALDGVDVRPATGVGVASAPGTEAEDQPLEETELMEEGAGAPTVQEQAASPEEQSSRGDATVASGAEAASGASGDEAGSTAGVPPTVVDEGTGEQAASEPVEDPTVMVPRKKTAAKPEPPKPAEAGAVEARPTEDSGDGRRTLAIGVAAVLLLFAVAAGIWAMSGAGPTTGADSVADAGAGTDADSVAGDLGTEEAEGNGTAASGAASEGAAVAADDAPGGPGDGEAGNGSSSGVSPDATPVAASSEEEDAGAPATGGVDANESAGAGGEEPAAAEREAGVDEAAAASQMREPPPPPLPPPGTVVTEVSGEYEYVDMVGAWIDAELSRQDFTVVDPVARGARTIAEAGRIHVIASAKLVGSRQLQFFDRSDTEFTVSLTLRALDPATGSNVAGPVTETVRYTSVNMEEKLEDGTRGAVRELVRDLPERLRQDP